MQHFGLPKQDLLRKPREFQQVYRQGRRRKGPGFSLIYVANGRTESRLGISVHRFIRGTVRRNRIKRIMREVFRLHRDMFPSASDIVITVAPGFHCFTTPLFLKAFAALSASEKAVTV